jgi:hypothetical protein
LEAIAMKTSRLTCSPMLSGSPNDRVLLVSSSPAT